MKSLKVIFQMTAVGAIALSIGAAHAQTAKIPKALAGKWATQDSRDGQRIAVTLDAAAGTGQLSVSFIDERCSVRAAPMTMTTLGGRITLNTVDSFGSRCIEKMTLELVPNPGRDGETGYLGELRLTGSAASRGPILRGRLTAP